MIRKIKKNTMLMVFLMYLETFVCTGLVSFYVQDMSIQRTMAVVALALVLCTAFSVALIAETFSREKYDMFSFGEVCITYGIGLLMGFAMLYEPDYCDTVLVLPVMMCIVAGIGPAVAAHAVVLSLVFLWGGISIEIMVFYLIVGIAAGYLSKCFLKKSQIVSGFVTVFCTYMLTMCVYVFFRTERINLYLLAEILLGGIVNILSLLVVLPYLYNSRNKEVRDLKKMLMPQYDLMDVMMKNKKKVYAHATYSSELAKSAAESIGADTLLTKCGVYYYNYARTLGKNYQDAFIENAYWHKIPKRLTDLVLSLGIESDKVISKEAAVVLVTETLVLAKESKFAGEKADAAYLDAVITQRFNKGMLEHSEISIKDYMSLKKYLIEQLCSERKGERP